MTPETQANPGAWTPERVEALRALWKEGLSCAQIAKQLGHVTRSAVIGKAHRLGLDGRQNPAKPGSARAKTSAPRPSKPEKPVRLKVVAPPAPVEERIAFARAWQPLPGSIPRPWEDRGRGCKWPIDVLGAEVMHACCEPRDRDHANYCRPHRILSTSPAQAKAKMGSAYVRSLRRFAA